MRITTYALLILTVAPLAAQSLKFDFMSDKAAPDFRKVPSGALYSEQTGYGFEEPAGQPPFYFSVRVPEEGNYKISVTLGDPANDSNSALALTRYFMSPKCTGTPHG